MRPTQTVSQRPSSNGRASSAELASTMLELMAPVLVVHVLEFGKCGTIPPLNRGSYTRCGLSSPALDRRGSTLPLLRDRALHAGRSSNVVS